MFVAYQFTNCKFLNFSNLFQPFRSSRPAGALKRWWSSRFSRGSVAVQSADQSDGKASWKSNLSAVSVINFQLKNFSIRKLQWNKIHQADSVFFNTPAPKESFERILRLRLSQSWLNDFKNVAASKSLPLIVKRFQNWKEDYLQGLQDPHSKSVRTHVRWFTVMLIYLVSSSYWFIVLVHRVGSSCCQSSVGTTKNANFLAATRILSSTVRHFRWMPVHTDEASEIPLE